MDSRRNQVSVIIPARNRHHLLARAIRSVQAQVGVECDLIVVDDASDPPVDEFLRKLKIKNVRVLRNDVRRNAAYCRNRGAEEACFEHLAFLDSDDVWFPVHLKCALQALPDPTADILYVSRFGPEEKTNWAEPTKTSDANALIFDRRGDPRSSVLVCGKRFFQKVRGFDENLEKYQDWDFALRCANEGTILLGGSTTGFLDSRAADRMSSRINIVAARRFLSKHGHRMAVPHVARFFAVMLVAAAASSRGDHRECVSLQKEHLRLRDFPLRYWPLRFSPAVGVVLLRIWLLLKRSAISRRLSSSHEMDSRVL